MNLGTLIQEGGVFMLPLLALSVVALAIVFERALYFANLEWGGEGFRRQLAQLIGSGKRDEALAWLSRMRGPVAGTAVAGLSRWSKGRQAVENAMTSQAHREQGALMRFLSVLETTITASPLIGLLGTITGMMGVFRAVSEKMSTNPQADTTGILAGIGEALIATATGILVAVVCLFFHAIFQRLAERQMDATQDVANLVAELMDEENPRA